MYFLYTKMKKDKNSRRIAFAIISFIFGVLLLGNVFLTGNAIVNEFYVPESTISFIGIMLILSSFILIYSLNQK